MLKFSRITRGNPCHPPLVFLHGFLGCKEDWEEMLPLFEKSYYCIALDLPGHGRTSYSEHILSDLKEELRHLSEQKPILIGYSMGGRIALALKEEAAALILISSHLGLQTEEEKQKRKESDARWCEKLLTLPFETFLTEWYAQPVFYPFLHPIPPRRLQQDSHTLSQVLLQMSLANQLYSAHFPCPTLLVHGEHDIRYRELYAPLINAATVLEIEGSGHAVLLDNRQSCSQRVLDWLSKTLISLHFKYLSKLE